MINHKENKYLALATFLMALAVMIGAFGAHGLEGKVSAKALATFETGSRYHFYHGFALLFTCLLSNRIKVSTPFAFFVIGILLFSFNCYLYAITGVKTFAMIVPIGGVSFIIGWLSLTKLLLLNPKKGS